jgi:hypothetical protein
VSAADVGQGVQQGGVVSQWEQGVKNVGQGLQAWGGAVGQGFGALFRTEAPPPRPLAETPPPRPPAEKAAPVEESILNRETLDLAPPKAKLKEESTVEQMAPHVPSFPKKDIDQVFNATLWKRTKDESLGLGVGFQDGAVLVLAIKPGSPAAYSDPRLEINDRLLAVGGRPVAEDTDFAELLTTDKLRVVIKVVRNMTDIVGQLKAVNDQAALLVFFQPVDAADQRGLARAGRAANDDALALGDVQVNVAQHMEIVAVPLVDFVEGDDGFRHGCFLREK